MGEVAGVVLAAGPGRRMGLPTPKLLLPIGGKPMLERVLDLVERLPLSERVLVVGAYAQEILRALFSAEFFGEEEAVFTRNGKAWRVLYNAGWPEGMGSSLRLAAKAVPFGMLVFLGDMPYVSEAAARAVLAQAGELPVAPAFCGQRGFPVFLPASLRPKLLGLRGDVGARDFLSECVLVPWEEPGVILDLDRPEDLEVKPS
jgi:CTP:molybdopterin cytidylyltransferase MocA